MFSVNWQTVYSPTPRDELEKLEEWCKQVSSRSCAIEIGSYEGGTSALLANYFETVICIDPWGDHEVADGERIAKFVGKNAGRNPHLPVFMANMERLGLFGRVIPILGTSNILTTIKPSDVPGLIFVDGCHTFNEVAQDLQRSFEVAGPDTWVIVHDYRRKGFDGPNDPYIGVRQAVVQAVDKGLFVERDFYSGIVALRKV